MSERKVVDREEWLRARLDHLAQEKEFTRQRDRLSAQRRELPRCRIEKDYRFETPDGTQTLADLFDGKSQLLVYHFMFHPDWEQGCKSCSFIADSYNGSSEHLAARDVSLEEAPGFLEPSLKTQLPDPGHVLEWLTHLSCSLPVRRCVQNELADHR